MANTKTTRKPARAVRPAAAKPTRTAKRKPTAKAKPAAKAKLAAKAKPAATVKRAAKAKPAATVKRAAKAKPAAQAVTPQDRAALIESVEDYAKGNYPTRDVVLVACTKCRGELFEVQLDDTNGCALRRCVGCKTERFFLDSEEYWDEAEPEQAFCTCEGGTFHGAVGFARTQDDRDVRWVYIGLRCVACGLAGVYADWKIDYSPSLGLLDKA